MTIWFRVILEAHQAIHFALIASLQIELLDLKKNVMKRVSIVAFGHAVGRELNE